MVGTFEYFGRVVIMPDKGFDVMEFLNNISGILGILGTLFGVFSWLYYHKMQFYLFINKLLSSRREVSFDVQTSFSKETPIDFKGLERIFKKHEIDYVRSSNLKNSKIYNLNNFLLEVKQLDPIDSFDRNVDVRIINAAVTYKSALEILVSYEEIVTDFLEFENAKKDNVSNSFSIKYGKKNPFYGGNLNRVDKKAISKFICTIKLNSLLNKDDPTVKNSDLTVYKESINFNSSNVSDLIKVAKLCFNI
ncbi:MAG: hypothetical protein ACLTFU_15130 [Enterococcus avium]|uniref:hypothetical protein n=1 Tax=Enterococcus thailandicus TaxID=417368 RepID=UPI0035DE9C7B